MMRFVRFIKEEFFWSDLVIIAVSTILGATFAMIITGNFP